MPDENDMDLVREYACRNSEPAFAELVQRHIALVYSVALRFTRNPPDAQDVAQAVFVILARKAAGLRTGTILAGWLYETTRLTALQWLRNQARRRSREQEAHMQSSLDNPNADVVWHQVEPLLEQAMSRLNPKDRTLLALRFFENRTVVETAAILGIGEWAARKRAERALEKLRDFFVKRGVDSTASAIAEQISAHSIQAAPVTLAKAVTAVALVKGATASTSTLTLIKGALKIMAWTKAKTALAAGVAILLVAGTATIGVAVFSGKENHMSRDVLAIVRTNADNPSRGADLIAKIGPQTLPTLERLIRWRKHSWDFFGVAEHEKMRASAIKIVSEIGPAAVRPLTSALCDAVNNFEGSDFIAKLNTMTPAATALLHFSVPGSPKAIATLTNWLAHPERGSLFGDWNDNFGQLPDAAESLVLWLKNPATAYEAAHYLGLMGTNAAAAIPNLIEVCNNGIDTNPPPPMGYAGYIPNGKKSLVWTLRTLRPVLSNEQKEGGRGRALQALGEIGIASPEVMDTLQLALRDTNEQVRFSALQAIYALHKQPEEKLADLLNGFIPRRDVTFNGIVSWIGHLGENGRDALPWLERLAREDYVQNLPEGTHTNLGGTIAVSTETLRASAVLAICEITPSQINPAQVNGVELLHRFVVNWEATKRVRSETNATPVLAILTPLLNSTNPADAVLAAHIVLGIAPVDAEAIQALHRCAAEGSLNDRLFAAEWLWNETGDSTNLLKLAIEGLKSTDNGQMTSQLAPELLAQLGDQARPAVPALKEALWRQGTFARAAAGKALRKVAPEELPPIL